MKFEMKMQECKKVQNACMYVYVLSLAVVTQRLDKPTRREIYLDQCDHGGLGEYDVFLVLLGDVCQV